MTVTFSQAARDEVGRPKRAPFRSFSETSGFLKAEIARLATMSDSSGGKPPSVPGVGESLFASESPPVAQAAHSLASGPGPS